MVFVLLTLNANQYSGARSQVREQQQLIDSQLQELAAKSAAMTQLEAKVQAAVQEQQQVGTCSLIMVCHFTCIWFLGLGCCRRAA